MFNINTILAALGVFLGAVLSDVLFLDGVEIEDVYQAAVLSVLAAFLWGCLIQKRSA